MIQALLEGHSFDIEPTANGYKVNNTDVQPDIVKVNKQLYHILHEGQSHTLFIHKVDRDSKTVQLSINGKKTTVRIRSRIDQLLKQLGMEGSMTKKLDKLKAPMPGLIHSFKVGVGDTVAKGDPILILEAMKMENVIKSPGEGTIKEIHVAAKDSVEKNAVLVSFA